LNENITIIKDRKLNAQNELISKYEKYIIDLILIELPSKFSK